MPDGLKFLASEKVIFSDVRIGPGVSQLCRFKERLKWKESAAK
jgi:hypothetical protein